MYAWEKETDIEYNLNSVTTDCIKYHCFYYLIHVYHKRVLLVFYTPYKKDVFPMYLEYLYGFLLLLYYPLFNKYVKKKPQYIHPLSHPQKKHCPFSRVTEVKYLD